MTIKIKSYNPENWHAFENFINYENKIHLFLTFEPFSLKHRTFRIIEINIILFSIFQWIGSFIIIITYQFKMHPRVTKVVKILLAAILLKKRQSLGLPRQSGS